MVFNIILFLFQSILVNSSDYDRAIEKLLITLTKDKPTSSECNVVIKVDSLSSYQMPRELNTKIIYCFYTEEKIFNERIMEYLIIDLKKTRTTRKKIKFQFHVRWITLAGLKEFTKKSKGYSVVLDKNF